MAMRPYPEKKELEIAQLLRYYLCYAAIFSCGPFFLVAIKKQTAIGSDVFIVGGVAPDQQIDITLHEFPGNITAWGFEKHSQTK